MQASPYQLFSKSNTPLLFVPNLFRDAQEGNASSTFNGARFKTSMWKICPTRQLTVSSLVWDSSLN